MRRLDRVLIFFDWSDVWPNPNVWVLPRDVSDHCPLVLKYDTINWGPKPFRFNNSWLNNKNFHGMVTKVWQDQHFFGWMGFILKERLKGLKVAIKEWNVELFGKPEILAEILALDNKSEVMGLSQVEAATMKVKFKDLWRLLKSIDVSIYQRSRSKWLKAGDANTTYFHSRMKARKKTNGLLTLLTPSGWAEGPAQVRAATVEFFRAHFASEGWDRHTLDGLVFPVLSALQNDALSAPFTGEEVDEVRIMFDQFHGNACLPKILFSYFITLIPKVKSPQSSGEFKPISLLGCLYKLVSKVLAARLAKVIGSLIPNTQSAFIKGRSLVEGVVAVNEVIDYAKKSQQDLGFVTSGEHGCEHVFVPAICRCWLTGVQSRLGALMRKAVEIERFKPFRVGRSGVPVSLLQYADDTLCIGEASVENLWMLKAVLRGFELASGLKVNF
ncbi:LINE-1 reverse transcriptase like [Trifolium medium]|uniref:LINE-1 reverse transcriptase like n=1 Tax=Trifolium medium TaxID=97028 RepID=A0A392MAN5_9FABA|nr:LINE-1 reverse transcriptase like [Trifolium medium]